MCWRLKVLPVALGCVGISCSSGVDIDTIRVRLITDYLAGVEFTSVETTVEPGSGVTLTHGVSEALDYSIGVVVGEDTGGHGTSDYRVTVGLFDTEHDLVARRSVRADGDGVIEVDVVISRVDCTDCPPDAGISDASSDANDFSDSALDAADPECGQVCTDGCGVGVLECSGAVPVCETQQVATAGSLCRPSVGACDIEERCDGTSAMCPPDEMHDECTPGEVEMDSQDCGRCGVQMRTRTCEQSCQWGEWGEWGSCADEGACSPGDSEDESEGCGACGTHTRARTCRPDCTWDVWSDWGTCTGEGACAPGTTRQGCRGCITSGSAFCTQTCRTNCTWGACSGTCGTGPFICSNCTNSC